MTNRIELQEQADPYLEVCHWRWFSELKSKQITPVHKSPLVSGIDTYIIPDDSNVFFPDPKVNVPCVTILTPHTLNHLLPSSRYNLNQFITKLHGLEQQRKAIVLGGTDSPRTKQDSQALLQKVYESLRNKFQFEYNQQITGGFVARRAIHLGFSAAVILSTGDNVEEVEMIPLQFPK